MPKIPAVRESEDDLEIDQKRGEWPFVKFMRLPDGALGILIDCNEGGQIINEGQGLAAIRLSGKKAVRVREFLARTES